jgi:ribonucleotide monophosphatase NagD (HAD superfamily)
MGMGITAAPDQVLTPAVAAVAWLRRQGIEHPALFVPEATATEFAGLDPLPDDADDGAGAVVVGDLGRGWDFATLNRAFRLLMSDAAPPLVALGLTRYWRADDGLRLDAGPFVRALEYAAGRAAVVLGNPIRRSTTAPSRTSTSSRARWSWSATTCAPTSRVHSEPA